MGRRTPRPGGEVPWDAGGTWRDARLHPRHTGAETQPCARHWIGRAEPCLGSTRVINIRRTGSALGTLVSVEPIPAGLITPRDAVPRQGPFSAASRTLELSLKLIRLFPTRATPNRARSERARAGTGVPGRWQCRGPGCWRWRGSCPCGRRRGGAGCSAGASGQRSRLAGAAAVGRGGLQEALAGCPARPSLATPRAS